MEQNQPPGNRAFKIEMNCSYCKETENLE